LGGQNSLNFYHQDNPYFQFNFAYINSKKNYIINNIDRLLVGEATTMFAQNLVYSIHLKNSRCGSAELNTTLSLNESIKDFLMQNYPKQKLLRIMFDIFINRNLIGTDFYFVNHPDVHIIDFIRYCNNKFGKNNVPNSSMKNLLKSLQSANIKIPQACINNNMARKYLC